MNNKEIDLLALILKANFSDDKFERLIKLMRPVILNIIHTNSYSYSRVTRKELWNTALISILEAINQWEPTKLNFKNFAAMVIRGDTMNEVGKSKRNKTEIEVTDDMVVDEKRPYNDLEADDEVKQKQDILTFIIKNHCRNQSLYLSVVQAYLKSWKIDETRQTLSNVGINLTNKQISNILHRIKAKVQKYK